MGGNGQHDISDFYKFLQDNDFDIANESQLNKEISDFVKDSLDLFEFFMEIEEKYQIKIDDTEVNNVKTFSDIWNFINERL